MRYEGTFSRRRLRIQAQTHNLHTPLQLFTHDCNNNYYNGPSDIINSRGDY